MAFIYFSFHIQSESKSFKLQLDANLILQDIIYFLLQVIALTVAATV